MNEIDAETVSRYDKAYTQNEGDLNDMPNPIITIEMENGDVMKAELYPDVAPNTVNNFICLLYTSSLAMVCREASGFIMRSADSTNMISRGISVMPQSMGCGCFLFMSVSFPV